MSEPAGAERIPPDPPLLRHEIGAERTPGAAEMPGISGRDPAMSLKRATRFVRPDTAPGRRTVDVVVRPADRPAPGPIQGPVTRPPRGAGGASQSRRSGLARTGPTDRPRTR